MSSLGVPSVSVVLPVLDEERDIERLLEELVSQVPPPGGFEVLVADGGSTDATRSIVERTASQHANVRLLDNPGRLSSAGRNVGARAAKGTYVIFLDGHCALPRRDYLSRALELFQSSGADCLSRPQPLNRIVDGNWARAISAARHSWLGHNPGSDIYRTTHGFTDPMSAGAAYRRSCIEALGGYDERFDACEDVEFNRRVALAGYRTYVHPDLTIHYRPRGDLSGLYRQMERYGRGRARLLAKHLNTVPWVLVGITVYVLAGGIALGLGGWLGAFIWYAVPFGLWLAIAMIQALVASRGNIVNAAMMFIALGVLSVGLVIGFWKGLLDFYYFRRAIDTDGGPRELE